MKVTLTNTSPRQQVFVLDHETYCLARGACACDKAPGRFGRRLARSLSLATGATSRDEEEAILKVKDVARAISRGELRVTPREPAAPPPLSLDPFST